MGKASSWCGTSRRMFHARLLNRLLSLYVILSLMLCNCNHAWPPLPSLVPTSPGKGRASDWGTPRLQSENVSRPHHAQGLVFLSREFFLLSNVTCLSLVATHLVTHLMASLPILTPTPHMTPLTHPLTPILPTSSRQAHSFISAMIYSCHHIITLISLLVIHSTHPFTLRICIWLVFMFHVYVFNYVPCLFYYVYLTTKAKPDKRVTH